MLIRPLTIGICAAFLLSVGLRTTIASAAPAAPAADDSEDEDDAKPAEKSADKSTDKATDEKAKPATAPVVDAPPAPPPPPTDAAPAPSSLPPSPLTFHSEGWSATLYGFAELDIMGDSTQSFADASGNNTLARPNTVAGDNPRTQFTARNSRLGFRVGAPEWNSMRATAVVEMDFFGEEPVTTHQNEAYTAGPVRMRHFYAKLETPIFDVLAGQYHDLFAWGGEGFYPNTVGFLPLMGEIYHRNPQLRLSKTFKSSAADFEIAAAAVRPAQRDAGQPDIQGGVRLAINGWKGASTPGASRPVAAPMALGFSAVERRFSVTDFSQTPGNPQTGSGWGVAANAFLPIIPAVGDDLKNALSVTGEFTVGSGISDLYTGLTGGVGFPQLPNPQQFEAVPTYTPNIDPGIVTFDATNRMQAVKWTAAVLNAHYHLPIVDGKKLWLSGTYALIKSNNAVALTPIQGRPFVWDRGQYFDANIWWGVTPAFQIGLSYQHTQQTFGDGVVAHNNRGEGAFYLFF